MVIWLSGIKYLFTGWQTLAILLDDVMSFALKKLKIIALYQLCLIEEKVEVKQQLISDLEKKSQVISFLIHNIGIDLRSCSLLALMFYLIHS